MTNEPITIYSTTWCGYCRRLKSQLNAAGVDFVEVNIEHDEAAAEFVEKSTGGMRTVPTVLLPDGSTLTNPPVTVVLESLEALRLPLPVQSGL